MEWCKLAKIVLFVMLISTLGTLVLQALIGLATTGVKKMRTSPSFVSLGYGDKQIAMQIDAIKVIYVSGTKVTVGLNTVRLDGGDDRLVASLDYGTPENAQAIYDILVKIVNAKARE